MVSTKAPGDGEDFYRNLAPFHHFVREAFSPRFYVPLPADWLLLVADIAGSTRAVERGRYNEVNYLGAACIVAVSNALPGLALPCVFGGDGATVAVPPSARDTAVAALAATRRWGRAAFGLELRVGVVPMAEIARRGGEVQVAKLEFSPGNAMAMFRGDGFDLADRLVKEDDGSQGFRVPEGGDAAGAPDLTHLSCRWAPLASENGVMLCLIVAARAASVAQSDAVYRQVLERVNGIAALDNVHASPVKPGNLHARIALRAMRREAAGRHGPWWRRWPPVALQHLAQAFTFWFGLRPGGFDPQRYKREVVVNSDFRKVNGMLRLIIDCSMQHSDLIEAALEEMHEVGLIDFGAHRASHAIMTCVTPNVDHNEHVHFIDGSQGGLWSAAKGLKMRMARQAR